MKEISQNKDIDMPEKTLLLKNRAKRVSVSDVCDEKRESLASVLANVCFQRPASQRDCHGCY